MPTVELRFTALPAHVRTARLVAVSLARRAGVDEEVLDEVRLAVGEAATRAVGRHQETCPDEPVLVRLTDGEGHFVAEVVDRAADRSAADGSAADRSAADDSAVEPATPTTGSTDLPDALGGLEVLDGELPAGIDLAVIGGLVDDVSVESGPDGSVVRMVWPVNESAPNTPSGFGAPGTSA